MDRKTLAAYDQDAAAFAKDWHEQPAPVDLQEVVERFFVRGGNSADIGCGSGREVAWLNANGFSAVGFDASEGLLTEARRRYPGLRFAHAELPELRGIGTFDNVLCETVIMHLDRAQIAPSVRRLLDIVKPSGILYLSWRVTEAPTCATRRDVSTRRSMPRWCWRNLKTTTTVARRRGRQRLLGEEDSPARGLRRWWQDAQVSEFGWHCAQGNLRPEAQQVMRRTPFRPRRAALRQAR
jgi:SAM-dependent methyltransferase